jgi:putative oxidoreductase
MYKPLKVIRILCGALILVFGLMNLGLFGFEPPMAGSEARPFQVAMQEAGYFLPIITVIFILVGTCVALDLFGALASILLAPISINILLFHTVLEAGNWPVASIFFLINCFLLWYYRNAYKALFRPRI